MMYNWFECKIRYEKVMENGMKNLEYYEEIKKTGTFR